MGSFALLDHQVRERPTPGSRESTPIDPDPGLRRWRDDPGVNQLVQAGPAGEGDKSRDRATVLRDHDLLSGLGALNVLAEVIAQLSDTDLLALRSQLWRFSLTHGPYSTTR